MTKNILLKNHFYLESKEILKNMRRKKSTYNNIANLKCYSK